MAVALEAEVLEVEASEASVEASNANLKQISKIHLRKKLNRLENLSKGRKSNNDILRLRYFEIYFPLNISNILLRI